VLPVLLTGMLMVRPIAAFPLAPDLVLVMLERAKYSNCASLDGRLRDMLHPTDLEFYNGLQVLQSHRQVYSSDPDFDLAARIQSVRV